MRILAWLMLCVFGMFPYSYDTNVCFGVVSRLAYAAWPNCDSSPRVPVVLRMRGGRSGSLAWEVGPWDAVVVG